MSNSSILTVTDAATSQNLTTRDAVKAMLDMTGTENDSKIDNAIVQGSAIIAAWCGRTFGAQRYTETWRPERSHSLLIPSVVPIKEIVSVTEDGTVLASSAYEHDPKAGLLFRLENDCRRNWCASKIVLVYDAGYWLPSFSGTASGTLLPADVERACQLLAKSTWFSAPRDQSVLRETVPAVLDLTYAAPGGSGMPLVDGLPEEIAGLLQPYRHLRV